MLTTSRLQIEDLETRDVMNGDWFSANLPDAGVAALARADYANHGSINFNDLLGIYAEIEKSGPVTANQFVSLEALAANASILNTPGSVQFLETQVFDNNPANATFEGYRLGDLAVGSSPTQLALLVDKWFLGEDLPADSGIPYSAVGGSLFGHSGPLYTDVAQGSTGDCVLMASLAVTAARDSSVIQSMFTLDGNYNGTTVWTVRFYDNGSPVYVTVNNELPDGGGYFDRTLNGVLWAALAEKAYAEVNAFDSTTGYPSGSQMANEYLPTNSTSGLSPAPVLNTITGIQSYNSYGSTSVVQALSTENLVVLGTGLNTGSQYIVQDHEYAVISYNSSTGLYTLFNPWGADAPLEGKWETLTANLAYLETYFSSETGAASTLPAGPAIDLAPVVAGLPTTTPAISVPVGQTSPDLAPGTHSATDIPPEAAHTGVTGQVTSTVQGTVFITDDLSPIWVG